MGREFVQRPDGSEAVLLDRAEYDRLLEQLEDLEDELEGQRVARVLANMDAGRDVLFGDKELDAYLAAPSLIHFWRARAGLDIDGLTAKAKIAPDRLAALDGGASEATVSELARLVGALGVGYELLIDAKA
jgi:uncharacterized protein (DUF2384 family)